MRLAASACVLLLLLCAEARAQQPNVSITPYGGYNFDAEEIFIGGGVGIPIARPIAGRYPLIIQPSFEFYPFLDNATLWSLVGNAMIAFPLEGNTALVPYAIGGLSISHVSVDVPGGNGPSDTDVFFDLGGGVAFSRSIFRVHPYAEFEARLGNGSPVLLKGGVRFATR